MTYLCTAGTSSPISSLAKTLCCQILSTGSFLNFNLMNETSTAWHTQGKHEE